MNQGKHVAIYPGVQKLIATYITKNIDDAGCFYLFPGGGQEPGEELREAVVRECIEEIGQAVEVGELLFVREYVGRNHEFSQTDGDLHQVEFYFRCGLKSREGTLGNGSNPDTYQVGVEWVDLRQLANIRVYPKSLGRKLQEDCFRPIYLGDAN